MTTEVIKQRLTILSFMSLWMGIVTNGAKDLNKHNRTESSCEEEFSVHLDSCVTIFLNLHQQLGLFHGAKRKISVIYISVHRDSYCRQYIQSLQCIHDNLSSCSTDRTTSLVQQKLSQLWALTANKICHINDKPSNKTNTNVLHKVLPDQIHELFKDGPVHIVEETDLPHDCTGRMLFRSAFGDTDENIEANSDELSEMDLNSVDTNTEKEQKENIRENIRSTSKLDYLARKFEPLLQFLSYLFSPIKPAIRDTSSDENSQTIILENKIPPLKDLGSKTLKVKYETVLLKKLKITNMDNSNKDNSKLGESNKETVRNPRNYSDNSQNSAIKEFEISTEDRKTQNKETKVTTYKWRTRIKGVLK